ncbi:galactose-1-phosphate uridylyltransferase (plasmid) [Streptomyces mirabilis]|nr:galactose-1-phosphate uridylyltransferase [Streptomyces mirabilis]
MAIAPERDDRPQHTGAAPTPTPRAEATDPACPFCPGHERETPGELWRQPAPTDATSSDWAVRVVPHRYPVLEGEQRPADHHTTGLHTVCDGVGSHEVVIESPHHDWDLADGDERAVADVLRAYRARHLALRTRRPGLVLPFRNHGPAAGTSLPHPHSQIVATPIVPLRLRQLFDVARGYYDDHGSCLYTDETAAELADGERMVAATEHIAALAPYAARAPYETWIVPRCHQASFADVSDEVLAEAAALLHRLLAALRDVLGDVPYNYALISAPNGEETTAYFAWHLQLTPRLAATAGFELGSGIAVNPLTPEHAAARLRHALATDHDPQPSPAPAAHPTSAAQAAATSPGGER